MARPPGAERETDNLGIPIEGRDERLAETVRLPLARQVTGLRLDADP